MKKITLIFSTVFLTFLSFNAAQAQTEKGNMILGGLASFSAQFNDFQDFYNVDVTPTLGFFIENNFLLGSSLTLGYSKSGVVTSTGISLTPLARYYIPTGESAALYVQAQGGFVTSRLADAIQATTTTRAIFGGGAGLAFFLSDQVALEGGVVLSRVTGRVPYSDLALRLGVVAYLGRGNDD